MKDSKLQRIIFLDIDGPIINKPCYYIDPRCSLDRSVMNTQAIGYVNRLAEIVEAKIVTNSTHNSYLIEDLLTGDKRDLRKDLIKWGMKEDLFHTAWCTSFPDNATSNFDSHTRLDAIEDWQEDNGECDWICFDDDKFTFRKNLIVVDFEIGIDNSSYRKAGKFWGVRKEPIF
jgi:HAD domain in Swiss Army Knife RNA repair proteins